MYNMLAPQRWVLKQLIYGPRIIVLHCALGCLSRYSKWMHGRPCMHAIRPCMGHATLPGLYHALHGLPLSSSLNTLLLAAI